ncbi:MAG: type II toxin-antitoxin system RelE/ParE family toxin [Bacteroidales bacterium]|nr:type II toxin-antitoxin system RelE/ParE family toxin [Bacteroidales bacterium]
MVVKFGKEYLRELFEDGKCSDKHHRFQPQVIKKYVLRVATLQSAPNIEALYPLHSLNYEVLSGDKAGISSIRIDSQFRLEFIVDIDSVEPTITICTLEDITNHYK